MAQQRKNKHHKRATQVMKALAPPTNNAKQLCRQKKEANTSQNCALVCMRFVASTVSTSHLLSFVSMSQFCFWKILKYVILNMLKSASPCKKADERQPTKNSSKQKEVSRTEKPYVGRNAIKANTTDTRLDLDIASYITTTSCLK